MEHILTFLDEFAKNIVVQGVHMVYNAQVGPTSNIDTVRFKLISSLEDQASTVQ